MMSLSWPCPIQGCDYYKPGGFVHQNALTRHLRAYHNLTPIDARAMSVKTLAERKVAKQNQESSHHSLSADKGKPAEKNSIEVGASLKLDISDNPWIKKLQSPEYIQSDNKLFKPEPQYARQSVPWDLSQKVLEKQQ